MYVIDYTTCYSSIKLLEPYMRRWIGLSIISSGSNASPVRHQAITRLMASWPYTGTIRGEFKSIENNFLIISFVHMKKWSESWQSSCSRLDVLHRFRTYMYHLFSSSRPSNASMRQQVRQSSGPIMVYRLFGDKPSSGPMFAFLTMISSQNISYATKTQLSCHAQKRVVISSLEFGWKLNEFPISFQLRWKIVSEVAGRLSTTSRGRWYWLKILMISS